VLDALFLEKQDRFGWHRGMLLGGAYPLCETREDGTVCIPRDYRVDTTCETQAGVDLRRATEHTHGIGSTLLSITAVRAGEILDSIVGHVPPGDPGRQLVATAGGPA
jgi:L-ornithine N5-monooxygenase